MDTKDRSYQDIPAEDPPMYTPAPRPGPSTARPPPPPQQQITSTSGYTTTTSNKHKKSHSSHSHKFGRHSDSSGQHPPLGSYVQNNGNNMILVPQHVAMQYPTRTFCPATGGSHVPHKSFGAIGIIIGIVFFPIGLLAIPCDRKSTCKQCRFVIKAGWGGC